MHEDLQVWKELLYCLAAAPFLQPVKVHLHPWGDTRDERHILAHSLVNNPTQFGFPVFDTIRFKRRQLVRAQITRYKVIYYPAQPACRYATHTFEYRRAGEKYHSPIG